MSFFHVGKKRGAPWNLLCTNDKLERPNFGVIQRFGLVTLPDMNKAPCQQFARDFSVHGVTISPDGWKGCDSLIKVGYERQLRQAKT